MGNTCFSLKCWKIKLHLWKELKKYFGKSIYIELAIGDDFNPKFWEDVLE